ncbi:regulatory protein RecX [Roseofilum sp. BLCC_M154]|uniref:Regulatory protein RecX n=1 Tax=Roseofilum acuticapitatum BLCC-M154 TaxID=3022444 RepID=A0ABT7APY8_9CYAN|nr:regulatory protein RecX [Roseofilum acuticapitatum]MDJ1168514.1 regulatory protein RecX [Roseofilum acuticapitatum BLCC-M154]
MTCQTYFNLLLSRRDYSVKELEKKGQAKGFSLEEITEAIAHLQSLGYQSDRRLANSLIESGKGKYGKAGIRRKCLSKGIPPELFEKVWDQQAELPDDLAETQDLQAKVERKYKITDWTNLDPQTQAKVYRYLQYRGFNPREVLEYWQMSNQ